MRKQAKPFFVTIGGESIPVTQELVAVDTLSLDASNPRIRVRLKQSGKGASASQAELQAYITEQPGFAALQKQIRKAKGITEPIIVRHNGVVAEGNTRLAVVKVLREARKTESEWQTVPVTRLPKDVPERLIQLLLANVHISGKSRWRPVAQADDIYHLIHDHGWSVEVVADETGMSERGVQQYLDAYSFMLNEVLPEALGKTDAEKQRILESKFSHALEFIKGKKLKSLREGKSSRKMVANLIANERITGNQVRHLPTVTADAKVAAVLKKSGFSAAKNLAAEQDPALKVKSLKMMQNLLEAIPNIASDDLEVYKTNADAYRMVGKLAAALQELLKVAAPSKKGKHNG
jgi:hypothetical protein